MQILFRTPLIHVIAPKQDDPTHEPGFTKYFFFSEVTWTNPSRRDRAGNDMSVCMVVANDMYDSSHGSELGRPLYCRHASNFGLVAAPCAVMPIRSRAAPYDVHAPWTMLHEDVAPSPWAPGSCN